MDLSIVVPVFNEEGSVERLLGELRALRAEAPRIELIFVDDGSEDRTAALLEAAMRDASAPERVIRHRCNRGQSAALVTGVSHARGRWVATLDGDGQNDPADVPRLFAIAEASLRSDGSAPCVCGIRVTRRDSAVKRVSSRIANAVRRRVLGDAILDTGCGLKLFRRDDFLALPLFDHVHRFLPALFHGAGVTVLSAPVNHRRRSAGRSKYGVHNRLWVGIVDLFGVRWLQKRSIPLPPTELR